MPDSNVIITGKFEVIKYEQEVEIKPIDPTEKVDSITVGVVGDDISDILLESLKKSEIDVTTKNVTVVVDIENKDPEVLDAQIENITNTLTEKYENAKIAGYFDITLNVVNKDNNDILGTLTQLNNSIKLSVVLPKTLQTVKEGYTRSYYIIRNHDGEIEILNA